MATKSQEPIPTGLKVFFALLLALVVGMIGYVWGHADGRLQPRADLLVFRSAFAEPASLAELKWNGDDCRVRVEFDGLVVLATLDVDICTNRAVHKTVILPGFMPAPPAEPEPEPGLERMPADGALKVHIVDSTGTQITPR